MKIDFYTQIHKAIRRNLFNLSIKIASADHNNLKARQHNHEVLMKVMDLLRAHAKHEEKFFHPLIERKLQMTLQIEDEHRHQEEELMTLEVLSDELVLENNINNLSEKYNHLYNKINHYISEYLKHMAHEEQIMIQLQMVCSEKELIDALQSLFDSLSQEEVKDSINYMLSALNPIERFNMMNALLSQADNALKSEYMALAEQTISAQDWEYLKRDLVNQARNP